MSSQTHLHDLKFRMMTIDLLRMAKERYTYRELSQHTDLPVTVLSRYVKGHVLPTTKRAKTIWNSLEKIVSLENEFRNRITFDESGYFDNTNIISNVSLLSQGAQHALSKFAGRRITKVMTAAVDGIPIATMIAEAFGVDLVIAKNTKEVGVQDFIEESYIPSNSGVRMVLYIPKKSIKRGDSILIVDDVIRSGETQRVLISLVEKVKAEVAGIYALIGVGENWREKIPISSDGPCEVILTISPSRSE